MDRLCVKPKHLEMLTEIFDKYCPNAEIWAYGSRLKGNCHDASDLDLAVKSFGSSDLYIFELKELLSESNIPFIVDVHEFDDLPKSFQDEILKDYVIIYGNKE